MTWQSMVRLPDKAGTVVDEMAERRGLERAVALRIIIMEWVEAQERLARTSESEREREP